MSVPPAPTWKGSARARWDNWREKKSGKGGRGGNRKYNQWGNWNQREWNQDTNYQSWEAPQGGSDQIIPKGKGRHRDVRLSQGAQPTQPEHNPNLPWQPHRD
eukprot:2313466-Karenia_brevis.AAC.1